MSAITVATNPTGPAAITMREVNQHGASIMLDRQDPYLLACEQDAYRRLLDAGHRLPAGSIEVTVNMDALARYPLPVQVGRTIAQRAL